MRKPSLPAGWLLIASSCTPIAWAWRPQGHRTVGAIAHGVLGRRSSISWRAEARQLVRDGQGSPEERALQSNSLARNVAYDYPGFACNAVPARIVVPDRSCRSEAAGIARERLPLAGARRAALLEQMLAAPGPGRRL